MVSLNSFFTRISRLDSLDSWIKIFCILLGLVYILSLGASFFWIFDLFRHFMVQYVIVALVFALCAVLRKQWPYAAAMLVLAFICGFEIASRIDYVPPPASIEALAKDKLLKVIVYNRKYTLTEHQAMVDFIKAENPDIFFILEANKTHSDALRTEFKTNYPYQVLMPKENAFGMVAASKTPFTFKWKTPSNPKIQVLDNFILVTRIHPKGSAPINFFALHAPPPMSPKLFAQRNADLEYIPQMMNAKLKSPETNVIVLGDWNITPYSPFFSQLLRDTGLKNQTTTRYFPPSWPAGFYPPFQIPIDYILHKGKIRLVEKRLGPSLGSDHRPVIAVFSFEN